MTKTAMAASSDHFVSTWKTGNSGVSNSTSITVPMVGGLYDIDWDNDGNFDQFGQTNMTTHDYGVTGIKTIRIRGSYDSIYFRYISDRQKILSIDQWGTNSWKTMENAFDGALNLQIVATDTPDFSAVTSMTGMFNGAKKANPDTSSWNTSTVTTMFAMFSGATAANPDTSAWDTSAVTDMSWMFSSTSAAKPDTSGWDTSAVTNMYAMFQNATVANPDTSLWNTSAVSNMSAMFNFADLANPDTGSWDTAAVTDMSYMFNEAVSANPDTSDWDTSSVTDMSYMFKGTTSANPDTSNWNTAVVTTMAAMFWGSSANPDTSLWETTAVANMFRMFSDATSANPDVTGWNTANVTSMYRMFDNASSFDKDISSWSVSSLSIASGMLNGVKLSTANYDNLLIGWEAQPLIEGVSFSAGDSSYCTEAAIAARTSMIAAGSWNIIDGGQKCPSPSGVEINSFNASPAVLEVGEAITFSWASSNATDCFALGGVDGWRAEAIEIPSGDVTLILNTPGVHTFTLECMDTSNIVSVSRQVSVLDAGSRVRINSFGISPSEINKGESTVISWDVSNADSCSILKDGSTWPDAVISTLIGQMELTIEESGCHTLTLECQDSVKTVTNDQNVYAIDTGVIFRGSFEGSSTGPSACLE
jgi:surface protein